MESVNVSSVVDLSKSEVFNQGNLQEFNNEKLGLKIRTVQYEDGSIGMNVEDTAIGFGWTTVAKSGNECIRWKRVNDFIQEITNSPKVGKDDYIPESLFYMLGMKANNEVAKEFQKWLAIEVIPSIRKHGGYLTERKVEEVLSDPDTIIRLATDLKTERNKRKELELESIHNEPKVKYASVVQVSESTISVGQLAKMICRHGVDIGRNKLFEWMRDKGYLIRAKSRDWNLPTQKSMGLGVLEVDQKYQLLNGEYVLYKTPVVTGKGQVYFVNKILEEHSNNGGLM